MSKAFFVMNFISFNFVENHFFRKIKEKPINRQKIDFTFSSLLEMGTRSIYVSH